MQKYLDQLNKLAPKHKLAVMAGSVIGLLALVYLGLVSPAAGEVVKAKTATEKAKKDLAKLRVKPKVKKIVDPNKDPKVLRKRLDKLIKGFAKGGAYSNLVQHLKTKADKLGLKLTKIVRAEPYVGEYVLISPIKIEAEASYPVLVTFLHQLAEEKDRMLLVSNLKIKARPLKRFMAKGEFSKGVKKGRGEEISEEDIARAKIKQLDVYAAAAKRSIVDVKFHVDAYSYTGKPLSPDQRAELAKRKKRRKKRR